MSWIWHPPGVLTADVDTVPETTTIGQAMTEMLRNEIRHLGVSREDRTVGLISIRDLAGAFAAG
jgi:signal-transduction protein with cAMP-binding, CBS, and nucleotidyltransferase domain